MAGTVSTCGPAGIWEALVNAGFSEVQAIGAMANAIAESSLRPEVSVIDSNGARSNGLWQFNEASYPDSGKLITGNCKQDIINQVGYLKAHVSGAALNGHTGAEVAGNFAANFERCQGCQPGGQSYGQRVANAATVQGWVTSGHWPAGGAGVSGGSGGGGGTGGSGGGGGGTGGGGITPATLTSFQAASCIVPLNLPIVGQFCLLSKSQARGVVGALLMVAGGLLVLPGLLVLAAAGLERTGVGQAAAGALASSTPAGRVASVALRPTNVSNQAPPLERAETQREIRRRSPRPSRAAPVTRASNPPGTRADTRGTSPEFRRQFLGES